MPQFGIKTTGVGLTVRATQTHRKTPTLACTQCGQRIRCGFTLTPSTAPRQLQQRRHHHRLVLPTRRLGLKLKTPTGAGTPGQARDLPFQPHQLVVQRRGQGLRLLPDGTHARQGTTAQRQRHSAQSLPPQVARTHTPPRCPPGQQQQAQPQRAAQRVGPCRPQRGLLQLQRHTQHTTGQGGHHATRAFMAERWSKLA